MPYELQHFLGQVLNVTEKLFLLILFFNFKILYLFMYNNYCKKINKKLYLKYVYKLVVLNLVTPKIRCKKNENQPKILCYNFFICIAFFI